MFIEGEREQNHQEEENPFRFVASFRQSEEYRQSYERFFKDKKLPEEIGEELKRKAFESTEAAKIALLTYCQRKHFHYNPDCYSANAKKAIKAYMTVVENSLKSGLSREEKEKIDWQRSALHQHLARVLIAEGIVGSVVLARTIGRLILIDRNLDTYQNAAEPSLSAVKRKLQ